MVIQPVELLPCCILTLVPLLMFVQTKLLVP